jgi:RHS repeat-associated protein
VKALPAIPGGSTYYVKDQLGSVRELISGLSVIAQYEYGPFGIRTKVVGNGPDSDFGFAGYFNGKNSDIGVAKYRSYDARLARWLTKDPIGYLPVLGQRGHFNATDSNLYSYCGNRPGSCVDPLGLSGKVISIGGCGGYTGTGYGGEIELGIYFMWGGARGTDFGLYGTLGAGVSVGKPGPELSVPITYSWDADQFFGEGVEGGLDTPIGGFAPQFNSESDLTVNGIEYSIQSPGGGAHLYQTQTTSLSDYMAETALSAIGHLREMAFGRW